MSQRVFSLKSALNESLSAFGVRLNVALSTLGNITPYTFEYRQSGSLDEVVLVYDDAFGSTVQVAVGYDTDAQDPDGSATAINTALAGIDGGLFVRSVRPRAGSTGVKKILVLYMTDQHADAHPWRRRLQIGQAQGDIAAGASGLVDLIGADDVAYATVTVENRSTSVLWATGANGWVVVDAALGGYLGYPI
jgi:hypothetical protein